MDVCEENSSDYERTLKEVEHILNWADLGPDLNRADLLPEVQCLSFSSDVDQNEVMEIKLLEVNPTMLEFLKAGQTLTIRGDEEDSSVLCTQDETYEVRIAETSNSALIIPDLSLGPELNNSQKDRFVTSVKIFGGIKHFRYLELKSCAPRLGKLSKMLQERRYFGKNSHKNIVGFLWGEFLNSIQCSEKQLKDGLKSLKAYEIAEHWYVLDLDYHFSVLSSILNLIDSESYSIDRLDKIHILDILNRAEIEPRCILEQCFDYFFSATDESNERENIIVHQMRNEEVSKFCAQILLKTARKFNLDEFLGIWRNSVPQGVVTEMNHLEGLALVEEKVNPKTIFYFPAHQLPTDVAETFEVLFDAKKTWTERDILPYLKIFCSPETPAKYYLTRYTRSYLSEDGVKCLSAKHFT